MVDEVRGVEGNDTAGRRADPDDEVSVGGMLVALGDSEPEPLMEASDQPSFWRRREGMVTSAVASIATAFVVFIEVLPALSDQATGIPLLLSAGVGALSSAAAVLAAQKGRWVCAAVACVVVVAMLPIWAVRGDADSGPDWFAHASSLKRYQAPAPSTASALSVTGDRPAGWSTESPLGFAYPPGEELPGLIPIYQQRCISGCKVAPVYAFSVQSTWPSDWKREGEAFRCFDPEAAPSGTKPLRRLMNYDTHARTWALSGSDYYEHAVNHGFRDANEGEPLCYIWPPDVDGVTGD